MNLLGPLAALAGLEVDDLLAKVKRNAAAWSAIGIFALVGVTFLLVAINAALTAVMGPVWAPITIAGVALLVALAIFIAIKLTDAAAAKREAERRKTMERTALATTAVLTALPTAMKLGIVKKLGLPVGGALAVAYLLARNGRIDDAPEDTGTPDGEQ
jgi:hypothetical protein